MAPFGEQHREIVRSDSKIRVAHAEHLALDGQGVTVEAFGAREMALGVFPRGEIVQGGRHLSSEPDRRRAEKSLAPECAAVAMRENVSARRE